MNRVHRFITYCVACLLLSGSIAAFAQAPKVGKANRKPHGAAVASLPVPVLDTALQLTPEEKAKIATIHEKYTADVRALQPGHGKPDPVNAQKIKELTEKANSDIEAVLTPEQKTRLPEVLQMAGMLRHTGLPLELAVSLKLSDDQKHKIADLLKDSQSRMKALSPDEKKVRGKEIRNETHEKIMAVLNDDQKAAAARYTQEHPRGKKGKKQGQ